MIPLQHHHHIECVGCQRHRAIFTVFFYLEIVAIKYEDRKTNKMQQLDVNY